MEENVPPPPGRDLRTEIIGASWDWQAYFEPIALGASGLVITKMTRASTTVGVWCAVPTYLTTARAIFRWTLRPTIRITCMMCC